MMGDFGSPALVCPGEVLTFDGSASTSSDGGTLTAHLWDLGDGTTASGVVVEHAFDAPGVYFVQLSVQQGDECASITPSVLEVRVSPEMDFSIMASAMPTNVCLGDTLWLNGWAGTNTGHWSSLPTAGTDWTGPKALPDNPPAGFHDTLTYTHFLPGAVVTSEEDVAGICANLEHSFMGDLVISLTCPNGQSMVLHQQGGGGTYIGGANDVDNVTNPVAGDCWNYCWTPDAEWGTFVEHAANGPEPNVMIGGTPPRDALIPGAYSPVQPFSNLIGCPLNGLWVLSIMDLWAIDNGFICDWWIDFAPELSDEVIQFTPSIGFTDPDSAYWSGDGFIPDPENSSEGEAVPVGLGPHAYTYTVTNSFGCTYDTTLIVQVGVITEPVLINGDSATCGNAQVLLTAPDGYDSYRWQLAHQTSQQLLVGPGTYTVTVRLGSCQVESEPFVVVATDPAETPTITWQDMVLVGGEASTYQWFLDGVPIDGAVDQTWEPVANGLYTVEITDANGCHAVSAPYAFMTLGVGFTGNNDLLIHPQPAREVLLLSGAKAGSLYRLYDLGGQLMMEGLVTGEPHPIQVGSLASGLYVLELRQGEPVRRWPVMVE